MRTEDQLTAVASAFADQFGVAPDVTAFAPGRVNLLGEHTDYNGGYVLPMALRDLGVAISVGKGDRPGEIDLHSVTLGASATRRIDDAPSGTWSDYVLGCAQLVAFQGISESGLRASLLTSVPLGAGLSSSAALEVATLRALVELFGVEKTPVEIAVAARQVENEFVGMPCGIMDQFASSVGKPGTALFLNTRTLEYSAAPGLQDHSFAVIDSGVSHQLTDSGYATRVAESAAACEALGVAVLSDLGQDDLPRVNALAEPLNRRVRHVLTDNRLTTEGMAALKAGDASAFGQRMIESHASARDDYQITVPETDALVEAMLEAGALGARQTGGGWGGAVVALVHDAQAEALCAEIHSRFPNSRLLALT